MKYFDKSLTFCSRSKYICRSGYNDGAKKEHTIVKDVKISETLSTAADIVTKACSICSIASDNCAASNTITTKSDATPVTAADIAVQAFITSSLKAYVDPSARIVAGTVVISK